MASVYIVQQGMSIFDVCLNATGSIVNLDAILTANNFTDWTPTLSVGQQITIPDGVILDNNVMQQLATYPSVNNLTAKIISDINNVFNIIPLWILSTSYWNDLGLWIDTAFWID
jgi:phage tail protein X